MKDCGKKMKEKSTNELLKTLKNARDLDELASIVAGDTTDLSFEAYFELLLKQKGKTRVQVLKDSGVERTYGYQILRGERRPGRDKVIALGIAAGCTDVELGRLLSLAGLSRLYSKRSRDAVIIFAVSRGISVVQTNEMLAQMHEPILS